MKEKKCLKLVVVLVQIFLIACSNDDGGPVRSEIVLNHQSLELEISDRDQLEVVNLLEGDAVEWSSEDESVVFVDVDGNLWAKESGSASITARVGELSATCSVTVNVGVFVTGYEYDNNTYTGMAKSWHNDRVVDLGQDFANAVSVFDGSVHVVGSMGTDGFTSTAKEWIDGEAFDISGFGTYATAVDIVVNETKTYVLGQVEGSMYSHIAIWEDGVITEDIEGPRGVSPRGLHVQGNDVFVTGTEYNDNYVGIATYWKNGVAVPLSDKYSNAYAIYVDNGVVYVGGNEWDSETRNSVATLWVNGEPTYLTNALYDANIHDVTVVDGDWYAVGTVNNGSARIAMMWRNGFSTDLSDGSVNTRAVAIQEFQGDIYVAGIVDDGTKKSGVIWKNGTVIRTMEAAVNDIILTDILVK
ncbi:Ig-like domain-containing protein [Flagellimonas sp.]|jgi:hypothetical protein|uniref:Ig-like domain-containing protein n=1 Tax=Flagellimonas sp. TaxID=2058762 RepID=UPI003BA9AE17